MKKVIFKIIVLCIMFFPIGVSAYSCGPCGDGGPIGGPDGTGFTVYKSSGPGNGCGWWGASTGKGGVRVSLYEYKKNGTPLKIGAVDIWTKDIYKPNYVSSPSGDSGLANRKNCYRNNNSKWYENENDPNVSWKNYIDNEKVYQYDGLQTAIQSTDSNAIGNFLYDSNNSTGWLEDMVFEPMRKGDYAAVAETFGVANASDISSKTQNLYIVAELLMEYKCDGKVWAASVQELSDKFVHPKWVNRMFVPESKGKIGDLTGKGSDNYINEVEKYTIKKPGNEGSFDTYLLTTKKHKSGVWCRNNADNSNQGGGIYCSAEAYGSTEALCNNTYGMGIWYLPECCEKCVKSCSQSCDSQYAKGSFEHQMCAQGYCNAEHDKDSNFNVADCISTCTYVDEDSGCDDECKLVESTTKGNVHVCNGNTTDEFETLSCHDDNTKYDVVDKNLNVNYSSSGNYSYSSLKYYKIDCDEKVKLKDLPNINANAWLTRSNVGSLHLGLTVDYTKTCNVKYKMGIKNSEGKVEYSWVDDFSKSRLRNDIVSSSTTITNSNKNLNELKKNVLYQGNENISQIAKLLGVSDDELISRLKKDKNITVKSDSVISVSNAKYLIETCYGKVIKTAEEMEDIKEEIAFFTKVLEVSTKTYKELLALAPTSFKIGNDSGGGVIDARLLILTQQDHKGENYFEPTIELEVPKVSAEVNVNGSVSTTTDYLVLEPVTCVENEVTNKNVAYCVWNEELKKYYTKYETTTLLECDNVDDNGNATPVKAKVSGDKYSATLNKTLYYELPDSYVLTQSEEDGLVFHSSYSADSNFIIETAKEKCNDYLIGKTYTGKCLKKDNLYQYPQFEDKLIVDELTSTTKKLNYNIKINNIGYCGEKVGGYTYSCSYQFKKDTECSKCSQYAKGTPAYEECYNKNCSCEAVCNGNVSCIQKYCPTNCVSCGESTYYEDEGCDECNEQCNSKGTKEEKYACQYECCSSSANGNVQALTNCCYKYCENVSNGNNNDKYNECIEMWCDCPTCGDDPDGGDGDNYVYRSININDPFNGRENTENGIGLNWRGKIGYITGENDKKNSQTYDASNSFDRSESSAEYVYDLSSSDLKNIKKNRKIGSENVDTTYQVTKTSKEKHSKISSAMDDEEIVEPYCSYLLHDVFEANGTLKSNSTAGMGCK